MRNGIFRLETISFRFRRKNDSMSAGAASRGSFHHA